MTLSRVSVMSETSGGKPIAKVGDSRGATARRHSGCNALCGACPGLVMKLGSTPLSALPHGVAEFTIQIATNGPAWRLARFSQLVAMRVFRPATSATWDSARVLAFAQQ